MQPLRNVQREEGHHEVPARQRRRCIFFRTQNASSHKIRNFGLHAQQQYIVLFVVDKNFAVEVWLHILTEEEAESADEVLVADDDGHRRGDREAQRASDARPGARAVRHLLPADGGR